MAGNPAPVHWAEGESNLGPFLLGVTEKCICALKFIEALQGRADPVAARWLPQVKAALNRPGQPHDLPLAPPGTPFQQAVWQAVAAIPPGQTRSYQDIARLLGRPQAARAVGAANAANPIAVLIPCHRLIRADGALAGYAYGLDRKQALLDKEREDTED